MDRAPTLPRSSSRLPWTAGGALAILAVCSAVLATRLCGEVLRQMAHPIVVTATGAAIGE